MLNIVLGAVEANTAPALCYGLVGNGSRCIDLCAETIKEDYQGALGTQKEGGSLIPKGGWVVGDGLLEEAIS